ncbi:hypothetical protein H0W91_01075 [Patescibacteria group bacterium]|nr:hypothetical protein [Patescibacteria group bacterium]
MTNEQFENKILSQIFQKARGVTLTISEKIKIHNRIDQYIEENPLSYSTLQKTKQKYKVVSPFYTRLSFSMKLVPAFFVALLFLSGTSFAAQNTLPGDFLYPVKIRLNENAQTLFSFGAKNIALTEAVHANTRLMEIEKLSVQKKLNPETLEVAKISFNTEALNVKKNIDELKASGDIESADEVGSDFESSLKTHHTLLKALSQKDEEQDLKIATTSTGTTTQKINANVSENILTNITDAVDVHLKNTTATREITEKEIVSSSLNTQPDALKVTADIALKKVQSKINEAEKSINSNESVDETIKADANLKLRQAKEILIEGQLKLSSNSNGEAFTLFKSAQRKAEEAKLMIKSKDEIKTVAPAFLKIYKEEDKVEEASKASIENSSTTPLNNSNTGTKINVDIEVPPTTTIISTTTSSIETF